ncbi:MAG: arginase family protein [Clostridiales bacterium]|nr:arginase family protein [Clostridiales bacterium]
MILIIEESDVVILAVPFDGGVSFRNGAKNAPYAIRKITYTILPTTEHFKCLKSLKVKELYDIEGAQRDDLFENTRKVVSNLVKEGKRFTVMVLIIRKPFQYFKV